MEQAENQPDRRCQHCGTELTGETAAGLCPRCLLEMNFASRTMPGGEPSPQMPPPSPEEMAARFPQFEILECLGRGGIASRSCIGPGSSGIPADRRLEELHQGFTGDGKFRRAGAGVGVVLPCGQSELAGSKLQVRSCRLIPARLVKKVGAVAKNVANKRCFRRILAQLGGVSRNWHLAAVK